MGRKRTITELANENQAENHGDDEAEMELAAAKAIMEEQALKQQQESNELKEQIQKEIHIYNKAAMNQKITDLDVDLPWPETLDICKYP